jgi:hypothetical protein
MVTVQLLEDKLKGFKIWNEDYDNKVNLTDRLAVKNDEREKEYKNTLKQMKAAVSDPSPIVNIAELAAKQIKQKNKLDEKTSELDEYTVDNFTSKLDQKTQAVLLEYWQKRLDTVLTIAVQTAIEKETAAAAAAGSHRAGSGGHSAATLGGSSHRAGSGGHSAATLGGSSHRVGSGGHSAATLGGSSHRLGSGGQSAAAAAASSYREDSSAAASSHKRKAIADADAEGRHRAVEAHSLGQDNDLRESAASNLMRNDNVSNPDVESTLAAEKVEMYAKMLDAFNKKPADLINVLKAQNIQINNDNYIEAMLNTFEHNIPKVFNGYASKQVFSSERVAIFNATKAQYTTVKDQKKMDIAVQNAIWADHKRMAAYLRAQHMNVANPVYG